MRCQALKIKAAGARHCRCCWAFSPAATSASPNGLRCGKVPPRRTGTGPHSDAQSEAQSRVGRRNAMSTGTATAGAAPAATRAYAWVVLAMLAFIYIFNFLDRQLMSTLIESIKKDTGFTDKQMGFMTGFNFALFYTVFGVIVGFLADRTSRRNILFVGAFLWSIFTALCGRAETYPVMLAARAGVGVGEAAGAPPSYSIISDYF